MKKRIFAAALMALLFAATAWAAAGDQPGQSDPWNQMYDNCNRMMQSYGGGNGQPQGQHMSNNGMMGGGSHGNMMGTVEFQ